MQIRESMMPRIWSIQSDVVVKKEVIESPQSMKALDEKNPKGILKYGIKGPGDDKSIGR